MRFPKLEKKGKLFLSLLFASTCHLVTRRGVTHGINVVFTCKSAVFIEFAEVSFRVVRSYARGVCGLLAVYFRGHLQKAKQSSHVERGV